MVNGIDPSLYLKNQTTERTPGDNLGKDEFMKILMTQLQNQDPLNPMDDREFISQMATFSSLEQMMNMAKSIDTLVQSQMISPVVKYSHMIGEEVTYQVFNEETGAFEKNETSKVVGVTQQDGWAVLILDNKEKIFADSIINVGDMPEPEDEGEADDKVDPDKGNGEPVEGDKE